MQYRRSERERRAKKLYSPSAVPTASLAAARIRTLPLLMWVAGRGPRAASPTSRKFLEVFGGSAIGVCERTLFFHPFNFSFREEAGP